MKCFASVFDTWKNLVFQNLLHCYFLNPSFDTIWVFRFKSWHVVRDWTQNLWQVLDSWYHNPKLLFLNLKFGLEKNLLQILTSYKHWFLEAWLVLKKWNQNLTGCKIILPKVSPLDLFFNSQSNTSKKKFNEILTKRLFWSESGTSIIFKLIIWHVVYSSFQNLTRCNGFNPKSLTLRKYFHLKI